MRKHLVASVRVVSPDNFAPRWRAVCSCGWAHRLVHASEDAATEASDRHAKVSLDTEAAAELALAA